MPPAEWPIVFNDENSAFGKAICIRPTFGRYVNATIFVEEQQNWSCVIVGNFKNDWITGLVVECDHAKRQNSADSHQDNSYHPSMRQNLAVTANGHEPKAYRDDAKDKRKKAKVGDGLIQQA